MNINAYIKTYSILSTGSSSFLGKVARHKYKHVHVLDVIYL